MNNKKRKITIGCDPELFLKDIKTGSIVSAEGIIGGTKKNPRQISDEGHCVQEDNVMVEFNIPPANDSEEFINHINFVRGYLTEYLKPQGFELECKASHLFNKKHLNTDQAKLFGCEPDYNVYLKDENPKVKEGGRLRVCGGHIHIGYPNPEEHHTEAIVKAMDIFVGLPSVWLDTDVRRRRMYGTAGSFRFKPFGCEYRSLSNFWLEDEDMMKWAYDNTILAVNTALNNDLSSLDEYNDDIRSAMNESNVELARALYKEILAEIKDLETVNINNTKTI